MKDFESKILVFEMKYWRKMLRIGWVKMVSNEKLYTRESDKGIPDSKDVTEETFSLDIYSE